jgi:N-acetylneuraminic acid mutarotase
LGAPSGRIGHTAVWTGTKMIVWGGFDSTTVDANTGGQYDPAGDSWLATTTTGVPSGRNSHTAVWTGTQMIVWGGDVGPGVASTGGRYDPAADSWLATTTAVAPSARSGHTAIWANPKMIVWGGFGQGYVNTGGRLTALSLYVKN